MKNKKGFVLAAVLLVVAAAIIVPAWLSNQKKEPDVLAEITTESDLTIITAEPITETVETTQEPSTENQTAEYMAAYNDFLKNYNGGVYGEEFRFELVYFTDDDTPELFVSKETWHNAPVEIYTYADGEVVNIFEGGVYGRLEYVEHKSLVVINDYRKGFESADVIAVNSEGDNKTLFSHYNNKEYASENGENIVFNINGENVSESEYLKEVANNVPEELSLFEEGIPMTHENVDKYCK